MAATAGYDRLIAEDLAALGYTMDPRHIEGYMRLEHGTLDALSRAAFREEVAISAACVLEGGAVAAERLAASYGL